MVCDEEAKRFMDGAPERIANERYRDAYLQCAHDLEIVLCGAKPFHEATFQAVTEEGRSSPAG
jgi:hypothetical protein